MVRLKIAPAERQKATYSLCLVAFSILLSTGCGSSPEATVANRADGRHDESPPAAADPGAAASVENGATKPTLAEADAPAAGVRLSGRVILQGSPPARRIINTSKDPACATLHDGKPVLDEDLIVSEDGGVKNAFVFLRRGAPKQNYPMPEKPAVLNQQGCMFQPRVQGVRVGQRLLVGNADPVTHNVRSFPILNQAFNFGQPSGTDPRERTFDQAEREIEIQCDVHPWMHAYIFVMDHPYFSVSGDDGAYAIDGLPPGEYALESWHEKLGKQRQTVMASGSSPVEVSFTYQQ
jgi:hypothetical protein